MKESRQVSGERVPSYIIYPMDKRGIERVGFSVVAGGHSPPALKNALIMHQECAPDARASFFILFISTRLFLSIPHSPFSAGVTFLLLSFFYCSLFSSSFLQILRFSSPLAAYAHGNGKTASGNTLFFWQDVHVIVCLVKCASEWALCWGLPYHRALPTLLWQLSNFDNLRRPARRITACKCENCQRRVMLLDSLFREKFGERVDYHIHIMSFYSIFYSLDLGVCWYGQSTITDRSRKCGLFDIVSKELLHFNFQIYAF